MIVGALLLALASQPAPLTKIIVSSDSWHSMIAIPVNGGFEEWGFGDKAWYLEQTRGVTTAFETLMLPTTGVIEHARYPQILAERSTQKPARFWEFYVDQESLDRLRDYLRASIEKTPPLREEPNRTFYVATASYHVLHTCHHWLAHALRLLGIRILDPFCILPPGLWIQLDIAERMHRPAVTSASRPSTPRTDQEAPAPSPR